MGVGDRGARLDVFGESDLRFVDSLFTHPAQRPLTPLVARVPL
jgi:hypothetical protein